MSTIKSTQQSKPLSWFTVNWNFGFGISELGLVGFALGGLGLGG